MRPSHRCHQMFVATRCIQAKATSQIGVLPGTGWVAEHDDGNGIRTVVPLVGSLVTADGEVHPLPRSLDASWIIRPRIPDDERLIRTSAGRMGPATNRRNDWRYFTR